MANIQNRTRVVYVRVSDEEFRTFRDLCQRHGAKNMSDLVRHAMKTMDNARENNFEAEVTGRLTKLESSLELLTRTMERITAGGPA
jgi:hypothetical protein